MLVISGRAIASHAIGHGFVRVRATRIPYSPRFFCFFASPCATLRFGGVWRTLRLAPPRHTSFVLCVVLRPWPALRASARATSRGQLRERPHARANQKPVSCTVAAAPRASFGPCAFLTANQRRALPDTQGLRSWPSTLRTVVACA